MALRRGPEGALVAAADGEAWRVPAARGAAVIDTTGASVCACPSVPC